MNMQTLLESIHPTHSMQVEEPSAPPVEGTSSLIIKAISSHGIKVATASEDVMTVPWNVMRSLARDGQEPYVSLFKEAQAVMLQRLGAKRGRRGHSANVNKADLSLTASANDSPATALNATKGASERSSQLMTLVLTDLPKDLVAKAREKGRNCMPPISLKWAVRLLLEDWVRDGKQRS